MCWADWLAAQSEFRDQSQAAPTAAQEAHEVIASHVFDYPASSMRSYAIGGGVAYMLAIQAAYKRGDKTLPKETEAVPLPPVKNAAGKLAAKAA